ncbi:hypothetical protein GCM10010381_02500 [Streptomyces xantholiticus]|nr:hypothetical protein GCM10010381_02500 [Streptomyces xantholiticus]
MHDRPHPGECDAATGADQQPLTDARIDHPGRMAALRLLETGGTDLGEDEGQAGVLVEQARGGGDETVTHGVHGRNLLSDGAVSGRIRRSWNRSRSGASAVAGVTRGTRSYRTQSASSVEVAAGPCFSSPVIRAMSPPRSPNPEETVVDGVPDAVVGHVHHRTTSSLLEVKQARG